ncbi:MAG TPA: nucleotidyltransferase domain-containing protein [Candidatus Hydrogenedentes bacterium]|nr:nucleotidyltransferase domain-containing protein [Candidatus Hydrogenedentota bacterium]
MQLPIEIDSERIAASCGKHHITKLALFGSVLTERFGPDSDVDVLFEYHPEHVPSLFEVVRMERELSEILGRKADMRTPEDLSRYFRDEVVRRAVVQYVA